MAKFRYRMQSILDIKSKMETQAKQEFAAAKNALDKEEEILMGLHKRKTLYEQEGRELLKGHLIVRDINDNKEAILRMEDFISTQLVQVNKAQARLESARERMTNAMKERKTYETLKEKAFDDFILELNHQESKEVDELTSYTYGQKRQVNQ